MSKPRIFAHMVVRNEADRYLQAVLRALLPQVCAVHVHDDASTDDTVGLAVAEGAVVTHRFAAEVSFAEHEGRFRYQAWRRFEEAINPSPGDWVLAIDADELLVTDCLAQATSAALRAGTTAVPVPIREVFDVQEKFLWLRVDGFWGHGVQPRLFEYQQGGVFRDAALGCGSVPTYVPARGLPDYRVCLAHLGYLDPTDRAAKHARYHGRPGHSAAHVGSILLPGRLTPWDYRGPPLWRGVRVG